MNRQYSYNTTQITTITHRSEHFMPDKKKGKIEEAAEKTGEVIGKGVKTGWGAVKSLGKGFKKGVENKKE